MFTSYLAYLCSKARTDWLGIGTEISTENYLITTFIVVQELVEKLNKGELPKNDYPCMNDPSPSFHGTPSHPSSTRTGEAHLAHSVRSRRTATWARPRNSDDGYSRYVRCWFCSYMFRTKREKINFWQDQYSILNRNL